MSRNSWIMFGMVAVVIFSLLLVALLIFVPQSQPITNASIDDYESISESEYSYTQSKDISEEAMKETYSITSEDINEGKSSKLYKQGNTDPFATAEKESTGKNNSGASSSSGNGGTNVNPYSAEDK